MVYSILLTDWPFVIIAIAFMSIPVSIGVELILIGIDLVTMLAFAIYLFIKISKDHQARVEALHQYQKQNHIDSNPSPTSQT